MLMLRSLLLFAFSGIMFLVNSAAAGVSDTGTVSHSDSTARSSIDSLMKARLTIKTEPSGAVIILDDSLQGISPVTFASIDTGMHRLQLKKKGFYLKKAEVRVDSYGDKEFLFTLLQPGGLVIKSDPSGATVSVNGISVGITPFSYTKVKPGDYSISVMKEHFNTVEKVCTVKSGMLDSVDIVLHSVTADQDSVHHVEAARRNLRSKLTTGIISISFSIFALAIFFMETLGHK